MENPIRRTVKIMQARENECLDSIAAPFSESVESQHQLPLFISLSLSLSLLHRITRTSADTFNPWTRVNRGQNRRPPIILYNLHDSSFSASIYEQNIFCFPLFSVPIFFSLFFIGGNFPTKPNKLLHSQFEKDTCYNGKHFPENIKHTKKEMR